MKLPKAPQDQLPSKTDCELIKSKSNTPESTLKNDGATAHASDHALRAAVFKVLRLIAAKGGRRAGRVDPREAPANRISSTRRSQA